MPPTIYLLRISFHRSRDGRHLHAKLVIRIPSQSLQVSSEHLLCKGIGRGLRLSKLRVYQVYTSRGLEVNKRSNSSASPYTPPPMLVGTLPSLVEVKGNP